MKSSRKRWLRDKVLPLGWKIIEYKLFYYYPEMVHPDWHRELTIQDDLYDELERNYLRYSFALKDRNYNVHKKHFEWQDDTYAMFEVDFDRPSVQLVLSKIGTPKMKNVSPAEEKAKVPHLRLLRGGKGPPEAPTGEDWLSPLNRGTAFACKLKGNSSHVVEIYVISFKHTKTVVLVNGLNPADRFGCDPEAFCKKYILFETLGKEEAEELPEGEDNGSKGTLRPRDVADDADAP